MLEPYERLFEYPWVELLGVRLGGQDVAAVNTLANHFSEAEGVMRRKLCPEKGQRAIAEALGEAIVASAKTTPTTIPLRDRLYNATGSIPLGLKLAALLTIGGWNVARLLVGEVARGSCGPSDQAAPSGFPNQRGSSGPPGRRQRRWSG